MVDIVWRVILTVSQRVVVRERRRKVGSLQPRQEATVVAPPELCQIGDARRLTTDPVVDEPPITVGMVGDEKS